MKTRNQAIQKAYERFGEKGLDAWDLTRANQVLGFCYYAGYISLEECLDVSLWIAQHLQRAFHSWDEIAASYMYGHQFWAKDDARVFYTLYSGREKPDLETLISYSTDFLPSSEEEYTIIDTGEVEKDGEYELYILIEHMEYGEEKLQYYCEKWKEEEEWNTVTIVLDVPRTEASDKDEVLELLFASVKM
jgi:Protein of unknown function (DUF1266).